MSVATAMDVREWIHDLTKNEKIGKESRDTSLYGRSNGNFKKTLTEPMQIEVGGQPVDLPFGTELVVYRQLRRGEKGEWLAFNGDALATIFLKEGSRVVEQISVRMNGRIVRRLL